MKKIFTLLSLLVMTVTAMAFDFTDKRVTQEEGREVLHETDNEKLTVDDNGDGTYNVTFHDVVAYYNESTKDDFGSMTFSNVSGTVEDGFVVISGENLSGTTTADASGPDKATVYVKFKEDGSKAYATLTTHTYVFGMTVIVTFGTDEGWDGTDPDPDPDPEQPVIEGNPIAELTNYSPNGSTFEFPFTCDFATQKLVWEVDFTNAGWTQNELVFTIGTSDADLSKWATTTGGNAHFYYTKSNANGGNIVFHYLHQDGEVQTRNDVDNIAVENLTKFTLDAEGFHVGDQLVVAAEKMPRLYEGGTEFLFGSKEGAGRSFVTYNYVTIVDLPKTPEATEYTGTWNVVRKGSDEMQSVEDAKVSILLKDETTAQVTIPEFSDQDEETEGTVAPLTFDVTYTTAEEDGQQVVKFVCNDVNVEMTEGDWNGYPASISMDGKLVGDELTAKFNVVLGGMEEYTYELGFNYEPFVAVTVPFKDVASVTFGEQTTNFDEANVDLTEYEQNKFSITYKDVTLNGNNIGDLTIENITGTIDETTEETTLTTTATTATWTRVTENNALGVDAGDEVDIRNFEGTATPSDDEESEDFGSLKFKFGFNVQGEWVDVVFGESTPTPPEVEDYAINFDKDGQNNHSSRRTTSVSLQQEGKDVQTLTFNSSLNGYEDHSADMEFSVEAGSEVATTFGYNGEWMHGYVYIDLDDNKQFDVVADDLANSPELVAYSYYSGYNSKGEAAASSVNVTPPTFTAPATPGTYRIRFKIDWDNVDPGGCVDAGNHILNNGGGIWDATLKVTEPVEDGISTVNAAVAAGEAELYTIDGVKLNKLQKGLNIVRTADGKVKKLLVK